MSKNIIIWIAVIIVIIVAVLGWRYFIRQPAVTTPPLIKVSTSPAPVNTYGLNEYTDSMYGFSFWYPSALEITSANTEDSANFPGGVAVETLQVGSIGGTSIVVVNSPTSTITDEPSNHASPISQTEYFYDSASHQWMVAYPQGANGPGSGATTTANVSKTTMSGLIMLPSGKRFDTTIIPLSKTLFLVISDGGGSAFTNQMAETVAPTGAPVSASAQTAVLQAEAAAYANQ